MNDIPMHQPCSGYVQFDGKFPGIKGKKYCLIHSSDAHTNEPICYSLYDNENSKHTNKFLQLMKSKYPVSIKGAISDFGKGKCFIKQIETVFPDTVHQICTVHYLRYVNLFLPRTRRSQYFLRNKLMKSLIKNMLHSPDRSESELWYLMFEHFIPFFKADYHKRFIRSITKHYHRLTAFYDDSNLRSDTNAIENRNRQLERKLKNMDGFGSTENAKSFLRIWFYYEKKKFENCTE
jgi:transposase-like protein